MSRDDPERLETVIQVWGCRVAEGAVSLFEPFPGFAECWVCRIPFTWRPVFSEGSGIKIRDAYGNEMTASQVVEKVIAEADGFRLVSAMLYIPQAGTTDNETPP